MNTNHHLSTRVLGMLILCALVSGCNPSKSGPLVQVSTNRQEPTVTPHDLSELVAGNNTFAFD